MSKEQSVNVAKFVLYRLALNKGITEMEYANGVE